MVLFHWATELAIDSRAESMNLKAVAWAVPPALRFEPDSPHFAI
jgi:hypothetical protein